MKRVFITSNLTSIRTLFQYSDDYEQNVTQFIIPFKISENELTVIVVGDNLKFPDDLPNEYKAIDKEKDGILYHNSSSEDVKKSIAQNFENSKGGSHSDKSDHQEVFKILWDNEGNKPKRIIEFLFSKDRLERIKTDFLYHIYNGGEPSTFKEIGEIPNIQTFEKLYESFEKDGGQYNKQLDIGDDETEGADQRQKLSLLRDALLANK